MSTDFLLREQFVTDPAQVMYEYLYGKSLAPERASVINHLLYAVMSSPRLLGWLRDYSIKHRGRAPSRQRFINEFGRAVVDHGARHIVFALIRSSIEKENAFAFDEISMEILFQSLGGFRLDDPGTGGGEGTDPGTGGGGGGGGGTETGTGGGEGTDPGTGGGGGGGGTETGTGGGEGTGPGSAIFGLRYVLVTLEALTQYATQLRNAGVLDILPESEMKARTG
jgi:hypothetical protein